MKRRNQIGKIWSKIDYLRAASKRQSPGDVEGLAERRSPLDGSSEGAWFSSPSKRVEENGSDSEKIEFELVHDLYRSRVLLVFY
jgi:hypothetical protein